MVLWVIYFNQDFDVFMLQFCRVHTKKRHRQLMYNAASLRKLTGMTRLELSLHAGVTEETVKNWEKSPIGIKQIEPVPKFGETLSCPSSNPTTLNRDTWPAP
jgi:DNA-binding XRE family transcriptional regulator